MRYICRYLLRVLEHSSGQSVEEEYKIKFLSAPFDPNQVLFHRASSLQLQHQTLELWGPYEAEFKVSLFLALAEAEKETGGKKQGTELTNMYFDPADVASRHRNLVHTEKQKRKSRQKKEKKEKVNTLEPCIANIWSMQNSSKRDISKKKRRKMDWKEERRRGEYRYRKEKKSKDRDGEKQWEKRLPLLTLTVTALATKPKKNTLADRKFHSHYATTWAFHQSSNVFGWSNIMVEQAWRSGTQFESFFLFLHFRAILDSVLCFFDCFSVCLLLFVTSNDSFLVSRLTPERTAENNLLISFPQGAIDSGAPHFLGALLRSSTSSIVGALCSFGFSPPLSAALDLAVSVNFESTSSIGQEPDEKQGSPSAFIPVSSSSLLATAADMLATWLLSHPLASVSTLGVHLTGEVEITSRICSFLQSRVAGSSKALKETLYLLHTVTAPVCQSSLHLMNLFPTPLSFSFSFSFSLF